MKAKKTFKEQFMSVVNRIKRSKRVDSKSPVMEIRVCEYSQPHMLRYRMHSAGMTHGQTVIADLDSVRLDRIGSKNPIIIMFLCPLWSVNIKKQITTGDGRDIPCSLRIFSRDGSEGMKIPTPTEAGRYMLRNVELSSNGTMQIRATENTYLEYIGQ